MFRTERLSFADNRLLDDVLEQLSQRLAAFLLKLDGTSVDFVCKAWWASFAEVTSKDSKKIGWCDRLRIDLHPTLDSISQPHGTAFSSIFRREGAESSVAMIVETPELDPSSPRDRRALSFETCSLGGEIN